MTGIFFLTEILSEFKSASILFSYCQLFLYFYFPKLWSGETGDLILILIGFLWIEMCIRIILELPTY